MTCDNLFASLVVPASGNGLSDDVRRMWVVPMGGRVSAPEAQEHLAKIWRIPKGLIENLLGQKERRACVAGAYYAALFGRSDLIDIIGRLLLRNEIPRAGAAYAVALADLGGDRAVGYLRQYLEHYLKKQEIDADQVDVLAALRHLDMRMGKDFASEFLPLWDSFRRVRGKGEWALSTMLLVQERELRALQDFRARRARRFGFLGRLWDCLRGG